MREYRKAEGNNSEAHTYRRVLKIIVAGKKGDYWRHTLTSWCHEIKELLEEEYDISIEILTREEECLLPRVYVNDILVFEGVPSEEGYLIELLKGIIESTFK